MSTVDTRWRIGDVTVDGLLSGQPTWSIGTSQTLEFYVTTESVAGTPVHGHHHEGAYGGPLGFTLGGPRPATYGTAQFVTFDGVRDREDTYFNVEDTPFGQLRQLVRYSGSSTIGMSIDGVPLVRETIPARADIESYIFPIEPIGRDVEWTSGAWVLVTDATDTSVVADVDAWLTIELEVTVLAPLTEYNTRTELEADMAPPILPD